MTPASDSLVPDSGLAPDPGDSARISREFAQKLFAELATRLLAFGIDLFVVLMLGAFVKTQILGIELDSYRRFAFDLLLLVYFAASWASPLHATPTQYLFKMRVYHESGNPLTPLGALVRSLLLVLLWEATTTALGLAGTARMHYVAAVICVLVFFVAATAHRQGIHDLLARSVVISNRGIQSAEQKQAMYEFLATTDSEALKYRRPAIFNMMSNGVVLGAVMVFLVIMVQATNDKNLRARVGYALNETKALQAAAAAFYIENGYWPTSEEVADVPLRNNYPDGGFYELQSNGDIRIHFEVKAELVGGAIVLSPNKAGEEVEWRCRTEGAIDSRYAPHYCRN